MDLNLKGDVSCQYYPSIWITGTEERHEKRIKTVNSSGEIREKTSWIWSRSSNHYTV